MSYIKTLNGKVVFEDGYSDFSGNSAVLNNRRKVNTKYYVYSKQNEKIKVENNTGKAILVEKLQERKTDVIIYIDYKGNVCFILKRKNIRYDDQVFIEKTEIHPFFNTAVFSLFSKLIFFGILRVNVHDFNNMQLSLGYDKASNYPVRFLFPKSIREKFSRKTNKFSLFVHFFWCAIPFKELKEIYLEKSSINIPVFVNLESDEMNYYYNLKHRNKDRYSKKNYIFNTKSYRISDSVSNLEFFVRKSVTGQYVIVFTTLLSKKIIFVEKLAHFLHVLTGRKKETLIFFEKFCEGASESGFELFKYAYEHGIKNAVYILDGHNEDFDKLKSQYGESLQQKNTFKAFLAIFRAKALVSSDLASHLQRRLYDNDKYIKEVILYCQNKIFLQHGPSLATNVFERGYFNQRVPIAPNYIVVNSETEKNLFLTKTTYKDHQLLLTGIPNLDLYVHEKEKEKKEITFFLTWRPWDLTAKIEEGSYLYRYQQFLKILREDSFYHDKKVNVILHPKARVTLRDQFPDFYENISPFLYTGDIKNALLESKILISDYSSVTFYAFTGGSNVIFYWEDKERAESEYGAKNYLQEYNAFGDIVMDFEHLNEVIKENYVTPQKQIYDERFGNLVSQRNGNNISNTFNHIYNDILKNV